MHPSYIWQWAAGYGASLQSWLEGVVLRTPDSRAAANLAFSQEWQVIGPFQIGTREAAWGADPLEHHGGFQSLEYSPNATFKSSYAFNGTVSWSTTTAGLSDTDRSSAYAKLSVSFLETNWRFLQDVYGWPALQWQGWARGEIQVPSTDTQKFILFTDQILEFWIDDVHYFGGDLYGYRRAPVTLYLSPGAHKIDVRLFRDIRAVGGIAEPHAEVTLELQRSGKGLSFRPWGNDDVLIPDVVDGDSGPLAGQYASVIIRNDNDRDISIHELDGMHNLCKVELIATSAIKLVPGQTRPVSFRVACVPSYTRNRMISLGLNYRVQGDSKERIQRFYTWLRIVDSRYEPHRITYMHPGGFVSYAILQPPSQHAACPPGRNQSLPVLISLHGASTEADSDAAKHTFDALPDLCAWTLFPSGVTPWSGDDWHAWGLMDVEAAVASIPQWIEQVGWQGPGVDVDKWLVVGHSNGGQGTWYALTHRPDKVIAAAPVSGYSSIQTYVPYTFWQASDPARMAIIHASLLSYRHEVLMENAKGIPVLQQHGSDDDNVPVYMSRLLSERIEEAGAHSTYFELPGQPHWWDGVMTTKPLADFFNEQLAFNALSKLESIDHLRDFSIVVANPGDMGPKNGVEILQTQIPGQLARMDVSFDSVSLACTFRTSNIYTFRVPSIFTDCSVVLVDGQEMSTFASATDSRIFINSPEGWQVWDDTISDMPPLAQRRGRQLGNMAAIFGSKGPFTIVQHSPEVAHIALQISRNMCQYFAADAVITDDYAEILSSTSNVISIAIGSDLPDGIRQNHPISLKGDQLSIRDGDTQRSYASTANNGLAAIYQRPLPGERLELVVWAAERSSLDIAARLVPLVTGAGQPDFVVADRKMLWKGVEGTLALGFFDSFWNVSRNSYLS